MLAAVSRFLIQVKSQVLLVKPLLAEVKELQLSGEVLPHNLLGRLCYRGLINISVNLRKYLNFI